MARNCVPTQIKLAWVTVSLTVGSTLATPIFELYRHQYRITDRALAVIFASYVGGVIISLLYSSVAARRWGVRSVAIAAAVLSIAASGLFVSADTIVLICVARVLIGISIGLGTATLTTMLRDCLPAQTAARYASASIATGLASGPLLAEAAIRWLPDPSRNAYWLYLPLPIVSLAVLLTIRPAHRLSESTAPISALPIAESRRVWMSTATLCCAYALNGFYLSLVPSLLQRQLATTHLTAALTVTILLIAAVIGQTVARHLPQPRMERLGLLALAAGGMLAITAVLGASGHAFLLATSVLGVGHGMVTSSSLAAVNRTACFPRTITRYYTCGYLASALPIVGTGWLSDQIGIMAASVVFFAVSIGCVLACFAYLLRGVSAATAIECAGFKK